MARGSQAPTTNSAVDPQVAVAKINRNSAIVSAAITATVGLVAAVVTYLVGHQQGESSATPVTATTTVTVTAPAAPGQPAGAASSTTAGSGTTAALGNVALTADVWTGNAWSVQDATVSGKHYHQALTTTMECGSFQANYALVGKHPKYFTVQLGVSDDTPGQSINYAVELDGAYSGAQATVSAGEGLTTVQVPVGQAKTLALYINNGACHNTTAVAVNPALTDILPNG
jgi:hypothetical protein